jgi:Putative peptidoglycan binding domain
MDEPNGSGQHIFCLHLFYLFNFLIYRTAEATAQLVEKAILKFQAFAGLPITGKLSKETVELMQTPRYLNSGAHANTKVFEQ